MSQNYDVVIVGGGAAGMMCAARAGQRGRSVLLIEHSAKPGEKIRISGGGRCNFTNRHASPGQFLSNNPQFCISALRRYSAADFISLIERYGIAYHEKKLGQLFCDGSSDQILALLRAEMQAGGVAVACATSVVDIAKTDRGFQLRLEGERGGAVLAEKLVIASGGKSIPKMGASGFGYKVALQFGLSIVEPRPGLVPLTFDEMMLSRLKPLAGIGVEARVQFGKTAFDEALLFTHRGLSGPAILQISSFWKEGEAIEVNLLPGVDIAAWLAAQRQGGGKREMTTALSELLPKRVAEMVLSELGIDGRVAELSREAAARITARLQAHLVTPMGTEGYRTAEVTVGGVETGGLSSKTMEARQVPGLYFIGEVVDVTGWLGGYNFQWAWSSGVAAGEAV